MQDIADACGVSRATVSTILGGTTRRFSDQVVAQVRQAATELGYHASRRMRRDGRMRDLILLRGPNNYLPQPLLRGLESVVRTHGWGLRLLSLRELEPAATAAPAQVVGQDPIGLLVDYLTDASDSAVEWARGLAVPQCWINTDRGINCLLPDDQGAARAAAERFLAMGHRRLIYLGLSQHPQHCSVVERRDGFVETARQGGAQVQVLDHPIGGSSAALFGELHRRLRRAQRPTALMAYGRDLLVSAHAAAMSLGLSVPGQLSISGFADQSVDLTGLRLECWLTPWPELAATAGQRLLAIRRDRPATDLAPKRIAYLPPRDGASVATAPVR